jgi:hypothetical protein
MGSSTFWISLLVGTVAWFVVERIVGIWLHGVEAFFVTALVAFLVAAMTMLAIRLRMVRRNASRRGRGRI